MQAVAKQEAIDTVAYETTLRKVLSTTETSRDNSLADWINTRPRPTSKEALRRYWRSKREHHQATATRAKPGGGIPLEFADYAKGPYVQAIHALPEPFPAQLRGAYGQSPTITEIFSVAYPVLSTYREQKAKIRAAWMLQHILRRSPQPIWEACGLSKEDWADSNQRKAWDTVRRKLRAEMRPAIEAWVCECRARGLEV